MRNIAKKALLSSIPVPAFDIFVSELVPFLKLLSRNVKVVVMPIAPPGFGKSWLIRRIQAELTDQHVTVICPDELRQKDSQDDFKAALQLAHQTGQELLCQWLSSPDEAGLVAYDGTHVKAEWRRLILDIAKQYPGTIIVGVEIRCSTQEGKRRHKRRVRINPAAPQASMPLDVIDRYAGFLEREPPQVEEGFDFIFKVINN